MTPNTKIDVEITDCGPAAQRPVNSNQIGSEVDVISNTNNMHES